MSNISIQDINSNKISDINYIINNQQQNILELQKQLDLINNQLIICKDTYNNLFLSYRNTVLVVLFFIVIILCIIFFNEKKISGIRISNNI
jgi:hypothetical protein